MMKEGRAIGTGDVPSADDRVRGLRANCFAAVVILLVEYGLGIWVNLYGHLPASDHGANVASGFARAVASGPVGLSVHAVLGVVLVVSAATAVVRAVLVGRPVLIGSAVAGLVAVVVAGFSGASFVGDGGNAASMSMAITAGVAIFAYTLVLFISASAREPLR
jgi:hypothetical protein